MFRALIGWMDRDWADRKYNPVFAFAQRLVWGVPLLVSIAAVGLLDVLGFPLDSVATPTALALGATGTVVIMLIALYRWAIGYSRSDFQKRAAAEHRAGASARKSLLTRWLERDGS